MKVVDILHLFKSWDVRPLLSVVRDAHVQRRQNQALEALLNQAPGFELNLFAKEPLKDTAIMFMGLSLSLELSL